MSIQYIPKNLDQTIMESLFIDWSGLPKEIIHRIFWHIKDLSILFRVSKLFFVSAYDTLARRLPLEAYSPLKEAYITMISLREYADDWQLRIMKNYVLAEIESSRDHSSSDHEEWLLYIEDESEYELVDDF